MGKIAYITPEEARSMELPPIWRPASRIETIRAAARNTILGQVLPGTTRIFTRSGLEDLVSSSENAVNRAHEIAQNLNKEN